MQKSAPPMPHSHHHSHGMMPPAADCYPDGPQLVGYKPYRPPGARREGHHRHCGGIQGTVVGYQNSPYTGYPGYPMAGGMYGGMPYGGYCPTMPMTNQTMAAVNSTNTTGNTNGTNNGNSTAPVAAPAPGALMQRCCCQNGMKVMYA